MWLKSMQAIQQVHEADDKMMFKVAANKIQGPILEWIMSRKPQDFKQMCELLQAQYLHPHRRDIAFRELQRLKQQQRPLLTFIEQFRRLVSDALEDSSPYVAARFFEDGLDEGFIKREVAKKHFSDPEAAIAFALQCDRPGDEQAPAPMTPAPAEPTTVHYSTTPDITCFSCGGKGHKSVNCPNNQGSSKPRGRGRSSRSRGRGSGSGGRARGSQKSWKRDKGSRPERPQARGFQQPERPPANPARQLRHQ